MDVPKDFSSNYYLLLLDTETTGLNQTPQHFDEIIEICVMDPLTQAQFHRFVMPSSKTDFPSYPHGITMTKLKENSETFHSSLY
jgi:DNA polymerase III epsilon subunit-like protein